MAGGIARTIPTDVSKESTAYKGELILDQDKRIMKFKARDGSIHIIEGASYDLVYESLEYNHKLYEEVSPVPITKRVNTANMLNDRLMMYDANLSLITTKSDLVEMTGAVLTLYDKDSDKIQMILPRVRTQDVFSLYYDANNNLHYDTLDNILASISSSFNNIYNTQLGKYVTNTTYTSDKQTYFTKGAGLDETKYGTAKAITTALDTLISNVSDNYLQKGAGFDTSKYANIKAITTALENINITLTDTGSVGSRIKTIEGSYLPKGASFDTTKYPNIKAITTALESATTTAGNAASNFTNYLIKGTNFDTTYPAIKSMNDIMSSITTASNNAYTAKSDAASALSTVNTVEQSLVNYLVKGDGFDTTKYANLKAITTALETINSSYLPKGTSWATKYSTIASMYDVMEKVTVLEGWKSSYPTTVSSTYVPFGAMSAADKTEFPDLYSIIDNIRNADNFMSLHSGPTSQVGVHAPVMAEVDNRMSTMDRSLRAIIDDLKNNLPAPGAYFRKIGEAYGINGSTDDMLHIPSYKGELAYGDSGWLGIYGAFKKINNAENWAMYKIRRASNGVYLLARRELKESSFDHLGALRGSSSFSFKNVYEQQNSNANDILLLNPITGLNGDENVRGRMIDLSATGGGASAPCVMDILTSRVSESMNLAITANAAGNIEAYIIKLNATTYPTYSDISKITEFRYSTVVDVATGIPRIDNMGRQVHIVGNEYNLRASSYVWQHVGESTLSTYIKGMRMIQEPTLTATLSNVISSSTTIKVNESRTICNITVKDALGALSGGDVVIRYTVEGYGGGVKTVTVNVDASGTATLDSPVNDTSGMTINSVSVESVTRNVNSTAYKTEKYGFTCTDYPGYIAAAMSYHDKEYNITSPGVYQSALNTICVCTFSDGFKVHFRHLPGLSEPSYAVSHAVSFDEFIGDSNIKVSAGWFVLGIKMNNISSAQIYIGNAVTGDLKTVFVTLTIANAIKSGGVCRYDIQGMTVGAPVSLGKIPNAPLPLFNDTTYVISETECDKYYTIANFQDEVQKSSKISFNIFDKPASYSVAFGDGPQKIYKFRI